VKLISSALQEAQESLARARICKRLRRPGIDSDASIPGIHKHLKIRALPAMLHRLAELNPRSDYSYCEPVFVDLLRSPGSDSQPGGPVRQPYLLYGTGSPCYIGRWNRILEIYSGLLKRLQIRALFLSSW
jgi:hypothetical protein